MNDYITRYFVGFVCVLALAVSPLSASAQAGEQGTTPEPNLQEPAPPSEPAPEEPALQLQLDSAGGDVLCVLDCEPVPQWVAPVGWTGAFLTAGGLIGMITIGTDLSRRQGELRELQEAHYGRPHRVQWDPARSQLVF